MTQAARGSGPRPESPDEQHRDSHGTDSNQSRASRDFYEPLPLGSDAFMAPLAPAAAPRRLTPRPIVLWCALGSAVGAGAGAIVLAFMLEAAPPPRSTEPALGVALLAITAAPAAQQRPTLPRIAASETLEHSARAAETVAQDAANAPAPQTAAADLDPSASVPQQGVTPRSADGEAAGQGASSAQRPTRQSAPVIDKPTRAQVIAAMARVQPAVKACFDGAHGTAIADMTIVGPTGRVTTAHVSGQTGRVGSCIARAVRAATFPQFRADSITIRYPMAH